jgi:hypothetical protein
VFKVIDKDQKEFVVPAAYTFISLLDSNGDYITGLAVSRDSDGNFHLHFPGAEITTKSQFNWVAGQDIAVALPDVLIKPLGPLKADVSIERLGLDEL